MDVKSPPRLLPYIRRHSPASSHPVGPKIHTMYNDFPLEKSTLNQGVADLQAVQEPQGGEAWRRLRPGLEVFGGPWRPPETPAGPLEDVI